MYLITINVLLIIIINNQRFINYYKAYMHRLFNVNIYTYYLINSN